MNRTKYLVLCFVLFISLNSYSQQGSIQYSHTFYGNVPTTNKPQHVLYFNSSASTFYLSSLTANVSADDWEEPDDDNHEVVNISLVDTSSANIYYRDLRSGKTVCRASAINNNLKFKKFFFEDEGAQHLNWILKDDTKIISGYECQRASVFFRGRNYEAWFTTEIPLPYGPWKLGGLPGLILEVYDDRKEISFTAEKITIPDREAESNIKMPNGIPITLKEYVSLRTSAIQRIRKSRLPPKSKNAQRFSKGLIRKAIELEYEWIK